MICDDENACCYCAILAVSRRSGRRTPNDKISGVHLGGHDGRPFRPHHPPQISPQAKACRHPDTMTESPRKRAKGNLPVFRSSAHQKRTRGAHQQCSALMCNTLMRLEGLPRLETRHAMHNWERGQAVDLTNEGGLARECAKEEGRRQQLVGGSCGVSQMKDPEPS